MGQIDNRGAIVIMLESAEYARQNYAKSKGANDRAARFEGGKSRAYHRYCITSVRELRAEMNASGFRLP